MRAAPEQGVAHLWRMDPRALEDPAVHDRCLALLSPAERARHDRLAAPERRRELAAAHALVRLALEQVTGARATRWRVRRDSIGRPLVEGPVDGVNVSVSHTPGLIACLVAPGRTVGIDAEQVSPRVPYMRIAEQVFAPAEIELLRGLDEATRIDRFFVLWSVKEAMAKARVELTATGERLAVTIDDDGVVHLGCPTQPARWDVRWHRPSAEHVLATCVSARDGEAIAIEEHVGLP